MRRHNETDMGGIMKKYSTYEYTLIQDLFGEYSGSWVYEILGEDSYGDYCVIRESDEWYDTKTDAETAAKAHIDRLESGEG